MWPLRSFGIYLFNLSNLRLVSRTVVCYCVLLHNKRRNKFLLASAELRALASEKRNASCGNHVPKAGVGLRHLKWAVPTKNELSYG